ncbi:MAG: hypothetical protein ABIK31_04455 [candidate division WOR-3 bacterium]
MRTDNIETQKLKQYVIALLPKGNPGNLTDGVSLFVIASECNERGNLTDGVSLFVITSEQSERDNPADGVSLFVIASECNKRGNLADGVSLFVIASECNERGNLADGEKKIIFTVCKIASVVSLLRNDINMRPLCHAEFISAS